MIVENIISFKSSLPEKVELVAVSKTKSTEEILEAYSTGQRIFGENYVQELVEKQEKLPEDIQWHFIGHLQRNKVKYIAPFVALIHGVHSFDLLKEINKRGKSNGRIINVLLQFHIAEEETKSGFTFEEIKELLGNPLFSSLENIAIKGVMGMATFTENTQQIRQEFKMLYQYFLELQNNFFQQNDDFSIVSMGMSSDYQIAIEEGGNLVRIGSAIFGERNYL